MKLKVFAALAVTVLMASSCGLLRSSSAGTSGGTTSGSSIGGALASIFTQYKTDGKLDLSNLSNILNIATILNDLKGMKNSGVAALQSSDFINGLIAGSNNLVNKANSGKVIDGLTTLAGLDLTALTSAANKITKGSEEAAQKAVDQINTSSVQVQAAVNSLDGIIKALK